MIWDLICFHCKAINSISVLINWDIVNAPNKFHIQKAAIVCWQRREEKKKNNKYNKWMKWHAEIRYFIKQCDRLTLIWRANNRSHRISSPCLFVCERNEWELFHEPNHHIILTLFQCAATIFIVWLFCCHFLPIFTMVHMVMTFTKAFAEINKIQITTQFFVVGRLDVLFALTIFFLSSVRLHFQERGISAYGWNEKMRNWEAESDKYGFGYYNGLILICVDCFALNGFHLFRAIFFLTWHHKSKSTLSLSLSVSMNTTISYVHLFQFYLIRFEKIPKYVRRYILFFIWLCRWYEKMAFYCLKCQELLRAVSRSLSSSHSYFHFLIFF